MLSLVLLGCGVTFAGASEPAGSKASEASQLAPELVVSPPAPNLDDLASDYEFNVLIRNPGKDPLPDGTLTLAIGTKRVETVTGLTAAFPESNATLKRSEVDQLNGEDERSITLSVPRAALPLNATSAPGAYLVQATFAAKSGALIPGLTEVSPDTQDPQDPATTPSTPTDQDAPSEKSKSTSLTARVPIVWRSNSLPDAKLSFVVPLLLPTSVDTMPTPEQLEEITPQLDELLSAATAERATLAIDPRLIAGIRAYGTNSPKVAQKFLQRLENSALPTFLLQFADADPAAQAALGLKQLLEPKDLDFVTRLGEFPASSADDTAGEDAEAAADKGAAQSDDAASGTDDTDKPAAGSGSESAPSLKKLLEWEGADPTAWPAEGEVDSKTLKLLESSGLSTVVLSSDNVAHDGGPRVKVAASSALVTDAGLAAAARSVLSARTDTERSSALASAAGQLAVAAQSGSSGLVLALDRGATVTSKDPAQLLRDLGNIDWVTSIFQSEQAIGTASLKPATAQQQRTDLLRSATKREASVDEVSAILEHPEYLTGYQRTRLLDLFATRHATPNSDFENIADAYRARDAVLMRGVRTINTQNTQLVGTSTRVPIQLRNSLPFDALASVQVDPASAALSVSESQFSDVKIAAESSSRILVPVKSRVSSGESGLIVNVSDASGALTVDTNTLSISIRSSVETIALWTLGLLAAALLGFGTWRSIRQRRRLSEADAAEGITPT